MGQISGAEAMVRILQLHGVRHIFGLCGDTSLPFYDADKLPEAVRRAFRAMTVGRPGAAHLGLPFDVQNGAVPEEEVWGDKGLGVYPSIRFSPDKDLVQEAAIALSAAELPIFVCGGGVVIAPAEQELETLAP